MKTLSARIAGGFLLCSLTGLGMTSLHTVQAGQAPSTPAGAQAPPAASQAAPPSATAKPNAAAVNKTKTGKSKSGKSKKLGLPAGTAMIWEDRGALTPSKVYWGAASLTPDPLSRLPAPPFSKFEPDVNGVATSPKAKVTDSKKVKWTAKFGVENHADTIAPRLAWALGFGSVEGYYLQSGVFQDYNPNIHATGFAKVLKDVIKPNGTFQDGARFKRHDKADEPVKDAKGGDMIWDEAHNPGVPPEQLSGLLIFEVLVRNWDSQPKNCKVYHTTGPKGPENWYIISDLGASFADAPRHKFVLADYQKDPVVIKHVSKDTVELNFVDVIHSEGKIHGHVPLAHAQWFRTQLAKLTEEEIQAAFDAGYATAGLNKAYASGDPAQIKAAREKELSPQTRADIAAFVAVFRAKIAEYMQKIPPGS
ncbi:MAG: hypothetical protein JWL77_1848 [Chthonomonadaceae bacterium]|nr:hypothetical protein [Chthonomonadaceae bacterium]